MLAVFIHLMEIALFALIYVLISRIQTLYTNYLTTTEKNIPQASNTVSNFNLKAILHGSTAKNHEYEIKMESLKKAQIFSGTQLLQIKRDYGELNQKDLSWLREAISLYLIGAVDFIGKESNCGIQNRKSLISLVLKSNLKLSNENSSLYFNEALYRKLSSDNDLMVRAGAKAAKSWLKQGKVPKDLTLITQLDNWGVFA